MLIGLPELVMPNRVPLPFWTSLAISEMARRQQSGCIPGTDEHFQVYAVHPNVAKVAVWMNRIEALADFLYASVYNRGCLAAARLGNRFAQSFAGIVVSEPEQLKRGVGARLSIVARPVLGC